MGEIKVFCTPDLKVATFLAFKGFEPIIDREKNRQTLFIYDKNIELIESLVSEFSNGSPELRLLNKFREIKLLAIGEYKPNYYKK